MSFASDRELALHCLRQEDGSDRIRTRSQHDGPGLRASNPSLPGLRRFRTQAHLQSRIAAGQSNLRLYSGRSSPDLGAFCKTKPKSAMKSKEANKGPPA